MLFLRAIILVVFFCFWGCGPSASELDASRFKDAKRTDNVRAYQTYIKESPNGKYKNEAIRRIKEIRSAWRNKVDREVSNINTANKKIKANVNQRNIKQIMDREYKGITQLYNLRVINNYTYSSKRIEANSYTYPIKNLSGTKIEGYRTVYQPSKTITTKSFKCTKVTFDIVNKQSTLNQDVVVMTTFMSKGDVWASAFCLFMNAVTKNKSNNWAVQTELKTNINDLKPGEKRSITLYVEKNTTEMSSWVKPNAFIAVKNVTVNRNAAMAAKLGRYPSNLDLSKTPVSYKAY